MTRALVVLLAAMLAVACSGAVDASTAAPRVGSVRIVASPWQASSQREVSLVTASVSAPDLLAPIEASLVQGDAGWTATLEGIPAGTNRTLRLVAFDSSSTPFLTGDAVAVTIPPGGVALAAVALEPTALDDAAASASPVIDSVVGSTASPDPGESVLLTVSAHGSSPGTRLSVAWVTGPPGAASEAPEDGSFRDASSETTTWIAPDIGGPKTLGVIASDGSHEVATMLIVMSVGAAKVTISFNTWPVVKSVVAEPTRINVGQATSLSTTATDAQGHTLSYAWSSTCSGTFAHPAAASTSFTLSAPLPASNACTLTVTVSDGMGGHDTGAITIQTGAGAAVDVAPQIGATYQSSLTTPGGGTVTLRATALDPAGNPMTFAWTTSDGSLGVPLTEAGESQIVWSAPGCILSGVTPTVTVTVSDTTGASAAHSFTVSPATGAVCPAPVAVVSATGLKNLALNATTLYYATTGALTSVPLAGGTTKSIATGQGTLNGILLDGTSVYWSDLGTGTNGSITKKPLAGGTATVLASSLDEPTSIALDSSHVYWASEVAGGWVISRVPLAGGTAQALTTISGTYTSVALAVDATSVYFSEYGPSGGVYKIPLAGSSTPTVLATAQNNPTVGAVDATSVYWTNAGTAPGYVNGAVMKVALAGGGPTVLASSQCEPGSPKVDGVAVYWANVCADSVAMVGLNGATVTTLATGQKKLGGLALSPTAVYWTSSTGVMTVPK